MGTSAIPPAAPPVTIHILKCDFKVIFKDGREFHQPVDITFQEQSQISGAIDRAFARLWTFGYTEKQEVAEKLVSYGPHYFDRIEMTQSLVQPPSGLTL